MKPGRCGALAHDDKRNGASTLFAALNTLTVDNYSTHKQEDVKKWLKKNKRVDLRFIPTRSSWLKWVARFFGLLTEKQLKRGVFSSVKALEASRYDFIARHNESPKPFVWAKSAVAILEKVNQARTALRSQ